MVAVDEGSPEDAEPLAVIQDRVVAKPVTNAAWCRKMDLIALVVGDRDLQIYRLSWQRVPTPELTVSDEPITALEWSPNGRHLALGYENGSVSILPVEAPRESTKVSLTVTSVPGSAPLTVIKWVELPLSDHEKPWRDRGKELGLEWESTGVDDSDRLTFLFCGTARGSLHCYGRGLSMDVFSAHPFSNVSVRQIVLPDRANAVYVGSQENQFCSFDLSSIRAHWRELERMCTEAEMLEALSVRLSECFDGMVGEVNSLCRSISARLATWDAALSPELQGSLLAQLQGAARGAGMGPAVEGLLLDASAVPGARKLLRVTCDSVEKISTTLECDALQNLEMFLLRVSELRSVVRAQSGFRRLGIERGALDHLVAQTSATMVKLTEATRRIRSLGTAVSGFSRWIYHMTASLSDESVSDPSWTTPATEDSDKPTSGSKVAEFILDCLMPDPTCAALASRYLAVLSDVQSSTDVCVSGLRRVLANAQAPVTASSMAFPCAAQASTTPTLFTDGNDGLLTFITSGGQVTATTSPPLYLPLPAGAKPIAVRHICGECFLAVLGQSETDLVVHACSPSWSDSRHVASTGDASRASLLVNTARQLAAITVANRVVLLDLAGLPTE